MGYQVDQELFDQALKALVLQHRLQFPLVPEERVVAGAKSLLNQTLWMAFEHHKRNGLPQKRPLEEPRRNIAGISEEARQRFEAMRSRMQESQDHIYEMRVDSYRSGLITLLSSQKTMSQELAAKIVDQCIIGKTEA